jgi:hypothetical protein
VQRRLGWIYRRQQVADDDVGRRKVRRRATQQAAVGHRDQQFAGLDARAASDLHRAGQDQCPGGQVVHNQGQQRGGSGEQRDQVSFGMAAYLEEAPGDPAGHARLVQAAGDDEQAHERQDDRLGQSCDRLDRVGGGVGRAQDAHAEKLRHAQHGGDEQSRHVDPQAVQRDQRQGDDDDDDQKNLRQGQGHTILRKNVP